MATPDLAESVWYLAWRVSERFRKESPWWFWVGEILGSGGAAAVGGVLGALWTTETAVGWVVVGLPALGGFIGLVTGALFVFGIIYIINLFCAPYRQRNELRAYIRGLEELRKVDVDAAKRDGVLGLLDAESVTINGKSDEGTQAKSFTCSQLLLGFADDFTAGTTVDGVEYGLKRSLQLTSPNVEWVGLNKAAKHLMGVLHQEEVIEIRHEEWAHWVAPNMYTNASVNWMMGKEEPHLAKGVSTRYFFTHFGTAVVAQIRRRGSGKAVSQP